MRCFKVTLEYDGTDFCGFQYQDGQRSVQSEVERAIERLTGQFARVHGAGRTDSGVHALGQVISFHSETSIPIEKLTSALNSALPRDVSAVHADEVEEEFHARFSAASRSYVYVILNRDQRSAVLDRFTYQYPSVLDVEAMAEGAGLIVGTRDFKAWANETKEVNSTIRNVTKCAVRTVNRFILIRVEANAFLRGMVRNMVGTLIEVGSGKRPAEDIDAITLSLDRAKAGPSAPARGLCLLKVKY
jgi:tRNA pseudouridine38-40 synthase